MIGALLPALLVQDLPASDAKKILDGYYKLLHEAKSIWTVEESDEGGGYRSETWLMRPRRWRSKVTATSNGKAIELRTYSSESEIFNVDVNAKTYSVSKRLPGTPFQNGLEPFTAKERPGYTKNGKVIAKSYKGKEIYAIQTGEQSIPGSMVSVFVNRKTLVPVAWEYAVRGRGEVHDYTVFSIDEKMNAADFAWKPPKGYKKLERPF